MGESGNRHGRPFFILLLVSVIQVNFITVLGWYEIHSYSTTNWGNWGPWEMCSGDGIVTALVAKVEPHQGEGLTFGRDDTALNGVALRCNDPRDPYRSEITWIKSSQGHTGRWVSIESCPFGSYAAGFQMRFSPDQGGAENDDTAANDINLFCREKGKNHYNKILSGHGLPWGSWTSPQFCPSGYGICGLRTQIYPFIGVNILGLSNIGGGHNDDTAMDNVNFRCCQNDQTR